MKILSFLKKIISLLLFYPILAYPNNEYKVLDRIIAVVEKEVITEQELKREIKKIEMQSNNFISYKKKEEVALEKLIHTKIINQYAVSINAAPDHQEVQLVIDNILKNNNITLEEFKAELKKNNVPYNEFEQDIKNNLYVKKIKEREIMPYVNVSKYEIDAWLKKNDQKIKNHKEYKVLHILIKSNDGAEKEKLKNVMNYLKNEDFMSVAKKESEGPYAEDGGDLGWNKLKELPALFSDEVKKMSIGEISTISSSNGIHILKLENIKDETQGERKFLPEYKFQQIFLKKNPLTSDIELEKKISNIKNQIISGLNFKEAVRNYSNDSSQKEDIENIDWVPINNFLTDFKLQFEKYPKEKLIGPFKTELGWHLLNVYDYRERDITNETNRETARLNLVLSKTELRFKDWIDALVKGSRIEIIEKN